MADGDLDIAGNLAERLPLRHRRRATQFGERPGVGLHLAQVFGEMCVDQQCLPRLDRRLIGMVGAKLERLRRLRLAAASIPGQRDDGRAYDLIN